MSHSGKKAELSSSTSINEPQPSPSRCSTPTLANSEAEMPILTPITTNRSASPPDDDSSADTPPRAQSPSSHTFTTHFSDGRNPVHPKFSGANYGGFRADQMSYSGSNFSNVGYLGLPSGTYECVEFTHDGIWYMQNGKRKFKPDNDNTMSSSDHLDTSTPPEPSSKIDHGTTSSSSSSQKYTNQNFSSTNLKADSQAAMCLEEVK
ncbi:MAG: hypothetical protein L6R41_007011 [Letrouitia leprolyta]|nr:MAG: hypothetical protein L6R41_007011 [Letrouitia leprolyta]